MSYRCLPKNGSLPEESGRTARTDVVVRGRNDECQLMSALVWLRLLRHLTLFGASLDADSATPVISADEEVS